MASFVTYTGNGVLTNYAVPFSYIDRSHVHAFLDGVETTAFTWFDGSTIAFDAAPGNGVKIRIERQTPDDAPLADFTNGQVLVEQDLDTATLQALFVAEEAKDRANQSIIPDQGGNFDLDGKRLTNVGAPVDPNDAATKAYADQTLTQAQTFASQAQAARDAALDAQAAAEAAFDGFDDRYLGAKASDPTLDNDGNPLIDGALYWNTTVNEFRVYDLAAAEWVPAGTIPHSHDMDDITDATALGKSLVRAASIAAAQQALDLEPGVDVEPADADIMKKDVDHSSITGSFASTSDNDGAPSSPYTPSPVGGHYKHIDCDKELQINAPTAGGCYTLMIEITNVTGAGNKTFSGFTKSPDTEAFTNTVGHKFLVHIRKTNSVVLATVEACQ